MSVPKPYAAAQSHRRAVIAPTRQRANAHADLLHLQTLAGNAAVTSLILQRKKAAKKGPRRPDSSAYPQPPEPLGEVRVAPAQLVWESNEAALTAKTKVKVTGRYHGLQAVANFEDPLPADLKGANNAAVEVWANEQVHQAAMEDLKAAPTAKARNVSATLGGSIPVSLTLTEGFHNVPPFLVSGNFSGDVETLEFGSTELKGVKGRLDLSVWVTTSVAPGEGFLAGEGPRAGDATVEEFSVNGQAGAFTNERPAKHKRGQAETLRTAGVNQQLAMAAMERWPDEVKQAGDTHPILANAEQRSAWLSGMRGYFGTDEAIIDHFAHVRRANVKGSKTLLHDEAATRLEAVQKEIGEASMPSSGGVGWPRHEAQQGDVWGTGSLHGIGYAVDYNAYETPHLEESPYANLARVVSGGAPNLEIGSPESINKRIEGPGRAATAEFVKQREAAIAAARDAGVKHPENVEWTYQPPPADDAVMKQVGEEFDRVAQASQRMRESLGPNRERFLLLKQRWLTGITEQDPPAQLPPPKTGKEKQAAKKLAAARAEEVRKASLEEAQRLLDPWRDKLDEEYVKEDKAVQDLIGHGVDAVPSLEAAGGKLAALAKDKGFNSGKKIGPKDRQRATEALLAFGVTASNDNAELVDQVTDWHKRFASASGKYEWCQSLVAAYQVVNNAKDMFRATDVRNPSAAQFLETGFFAVKGVDPAFEEANPNRRRFGKDFFLTMLKYGFSPGSSWPHPDGMHFELRWQGASSRKPEAAKKE